MMSSYYVACNLGADHGRVVLGTLEKERLIVSQVRRFETAPIVEKHSLSWNVAQVYEEVLDALREVGSHEEPVESISCTSEPADYLLVDAEGAIITPAYHQNDPRTEAGMKSVIAKVPRETAYSETGIPCQPGSTLFQLGGETSKRLKKAAHLLPLADGFNFLLGGKPSVELSLASATHLYNPITQSWSERLLESVQVPSRLLPPLVQAGTELGLLRPDIAKSTRLEDARVIASLSHEIAAALAGLPIINGEHWAWLRPGHSTLMGNQVPQPIINDASRELGFTNEPGYGGSICFYKHTAGVSILEECQRFWKQSDRDLDLEMLGHLAGAAAPFESLINPADTRFQEPGDMPLKIQAFCKETNQSVPRKPGPIFRCILESLALLYRKTLLEIDYLTGKKTARLYLLGGASNSLLNHFTANALQLPVTLVCADAAAVGNIIVQAMARGHIASLADAREIVRNSLKTETILPHANAWIDAFGRFSMLAK